METAIRKIIAAVLVTGFILSSGACQGKKTVQSKQTQRTLVAKTLTAEQADCTLEYNLLMNDTFKKAPKIGLLMEGGYLFKKNNNGNMLSSEIVNALYSDEQAKYLMKLFMTDKQGNKQEIMSVVITYIFNTFEKTAYISYMKVTNLLSGETSVQEYDGSEESKAADEGCFDGVASLLFDVDTINAKF